VTEKIGAMHQIILAIQGYPNVRPHFAFWTRKVIRLWRTVDWCMLCSFAKYFRDFDLWPFK